MTDDKVPRDVADAFDQAQTQSTDQSVLRLNDSGSALGRREMDDKPVGKVYDCETYDGKAYYSVRDESRHYMFKFKGYPIDVAILDELKANNIDTVLIGLRRSKSILEFDLEQYTQKESFDEGWGVQKCPEKDNAVRVWPNAVGTVVQGS
jgi:hypothetical protein